MSKLIVDMEMPKDCPMCPMAHYNKLDEFTGCEVALGKRYAVKTDKAYAESACRPDWCPIKCVLPEQHGDLIDRDVSIQTFKCIEEAPYSGFDGQEPFYAPEDVVNTLLCQDVVIVAERSKT